MNTSSPIASHKPRLDKWLWAARFFKTRSLCKDAISSGKIQLHDVRGKAKANTTVLINAKISITLGWDKKTIIVDQVNEKRGSAKEANLLYHETDESVKKRIKDSQARKLAGNAVRYDKQKPSKKDRRKIIAFNQKNKV